MRPLPVQVQGISGPSTGLTLATRRGILFSSSRWRSVSFFPCFVGLLSPGLWWPRKQYVSWLERSVHLLNRTANVSRFALPIVLLLLPAMALAIPSVVNVTATLNYLGGPPGNQTFRFDYAVANLDVQPALAGFIVFFDSDGVDRAGVVEYAAPSSWDDVFVFEEGPTYHAWNVEWNDTPGVNRILPGGTLGGFSVTFTWTDPNSLPGPQLFEAWNGVTHEGCTTVIPGSGIPGSIAGTVVTVCGGSTTATPNATVDLYSMDNVLLGTTFTDGEGHYSFPGLTLGTYKVTIVTPMGFTADQETKTATVSLGDPTVVVDFQLTCLPVTPAARTIGYWKHLVNVYLTGKGKAQESLAEMSAFMEQLKIHFNKNLLNPITLFMVDDPDGQTTDSLAVLQRLLTVNKDGTMLDRAKQQMVALLLNVVSLKLSQAYVISADGVSVTQAITFCDSLITDHITSNDERAKDIYDYINNGLTVPAGWIPLGTETIYYEKDRPANLIDIARCYPNPFVGSTMISFALKGNSTQPVALKVFDVTGRVVRTLVDRALEPGAHTIAWDGMSDAGIRTSSGVYFYELRTPELVTTGKLVMRR